MSSPSLRQQIGLDSLSLERPASSYRKMDHDGGCAGGFGFYLVWFLIIAIISWIVLFSIKPDFVKKSDGTVDTAKVLLWSVIIGLIGIFIIWLIKKCTRC